METLMYILISKCEKSIQIWNDNKKYALSYQEMAWIRNPQESKQ